MDLARTTALALGALIAFAGCAREPHPWDQGDAAAPPPAPPTPARSMAEVSVLTAPPPLPAPPGGSATPSDPDEGPVRVGGPWVRCYGNFRAAGDPVKDVTRLSLLCGPENGMVRLGATTFTGAVAEGGPPATTTFPAQRGACYRIFAVAEPGVADLDVTVRSSRGARLAADHGEDPWPIVQPDRPFCALEDDRYTVEVSARRGSGRFAAETWVLRTPGPHPKGAGGRPPPEGAD